MRKVFSQKFLGMSPAIPGPPTTHLHFGSCTRWHYEQTKVSALSCKITLLFVPVPFRTCLPQYPPANVLFCVTGSRRCWRRSPWEQMEAKRQHCTRGWHGRKDPLLLPFNSSTYSLTFLTPQLSFSESFPRQVLLYEWKWFHCPACQQQKTHLVTHHPLEWKDPSLWQKTSFLLTITKKQTRKKQPALTGSSATRKIDTSRTTVSAAMQPHSQREAEGSAGVMALSGSPASPQCPGEGSLNLLSWDQG